MARPDHSTSPTAEHAEGTDANPAVEEAERTPQYCSIGKHYENPFTRSVRRQPFRFFDLPPELRDRIYLFAMDFPRLETAAIPRTPDYATIPGIAQTSRLARHEALEVFFFNRPLEVTFHCEENARQAVRWLGCWNAHSRYFGIIAFRIRQVSRPHDFFRVTLERVDTYPYFRTRMDHYATDFATALAIHQRAAFQRCINEFATSAEEGERGRLSATQLSELFRFFAALAGNELD